MTQQISVQEAKDKIEQETVAIVDIRDPGSYAAGHIKGAIRLDNDNFVDFLENTDKSTPVIVCCYHGNSSQQVAAIIASHGFDAYSMQGGMSGWMLANPVEH